MRKLPLFALAGIAALAAGAYAGTAHAATIFYANFENGLAKFTVSAPGSASGDYGTVSNLSIGLTDPDTTNGSAAYFNNSGKDPNATFTSVSTFPIAANTTYTLQIYAGHRTGNTVGTLTISLLNGSSVLATNSINESTGVTLGAYKAISTNFTSTAALVGQNLTVQLGFSAPSTSQQVEADGLTLTSSTVPEPATLGVLSLGAIGLLGRRRRKVA